jgi:hypothetical protein
MNAMPTAAPKRNTCSSTSSETSMRNPSIMNGKVITQPIQPFPASPRQAVYCSTA